MTTHELLHIIARGVMGNAGTHGDVKEVEYHPGHTSETTGYFFWTGDHDGFLLRPDGLHRVARYPATGIYFVPGGELVTSPSRPVRMIDFEEQVKITGEVVSELIAEEKADGLRATIEQYRHDSLLTDEESDDEVPFDTNPPRVEQAMARFEGVDYPKIAALQKVGRVVAVIDRAHAFDPEDAREAWVDLQTLLVSQPDTDEQAEEIASALDRSGAVDAAFLS